MEDCIMGYTPIALSPGAVLHKGQFVSYVMKIRLDDDRGDHLFYLGYERVVELAKALGLKTQQMYLKGTFSPAASSKETLDTEEKYKLQNVHLTHDEIEVPDTKNVVYQLNAIILDDSLLLSIIRHDKTKIDISVPDPAIEIFTGYMMNTLLKAGGEALTEKVIAQMGQ